MPTRHAICSASASERWLHCTAAPRFEEQFPEADTSIYAEEGTIAHSICEVLGSKEFGKITSQKAGLELKRIKKDPLFSEEMIRTAAVYTQFLREKYIGYGCDPYVAFEVLVDLSDYIPEGFGTCDCVMIGGDTLHITDYKHGKGVAVSSVDNSQMKLYALGALKQYGPIFGDAIKKVVMAIVQPRITEEIIEYEMAVDALREWGEVVKDVAQRAHSGVGSEFHPGEWCRFCRGRGACRARADLNTALEDFKSVVPPAATRTETDPKLNEREIGELLIRAADLSKWYEDLKDYVKQLILSGANVPGWVVVEGRSNRAFSDQDKALDAIKAAGYDEAVIYDRKAKSLSELEKMIGKKVFTDICGQYIVKPTGAPTLMQESAASGKVRYGSAEADFAGVV